MTSSEISGTSTLPKFLPHLRLLPFVLMPLFSVQHSRSHFRPVNLQIFFSVAQLPSFCALDYMYFIMSICMASSAVCNTPFSRPFLRFYSVTHIIIITSSGSCIALAYFITLKNCLTLCGGSIYFLLKLWCLYCMMMFRWTIKQPGI